jgi:hypothetical protein
MTKRMMIQEAIRLISEYEETTGATIDKQDPSDLACWLDLFQERANDRSEEKSIRDEHKRLITAAKTLREAALEEMGWGE